MGPSENPKDNLGQIMKLQDPSNQRAHSKPSAKRSVPKSSHEKAPLGTRHIRAVTNWPTSRIGHQ